MLVKLADGVTEITKVLVGLCSGVMTAVVVAEVIFRYALGSSIYWAEELSRLKGKIKRALILQQESSPSRSGSMAFDWYFLGRVRTMAELSKIIDGLSVESINGWLKKHPPGEFTIVTLGKDPLEMGR